MVYTKDWQLPHYSVYSFAPKKIKYCICIPVINEGEKFKEQIKKMKKYANLADIIVADGGSTDGSTDKKFLKSNLVKTLLIKKDIGNQGTQLRMGFAYALQEDYEGIITIDGNGKDAVDTIPYFIKALEEGYDFVQGSRFIKGGKAKNTPLLRYLGIRFVHAPLISISAHHWYTDTTNGFRAYSQKYLLHPKVKPFRDIFVRYELLFYLSVKAPQLKLKVKEIPVERIYPKGLVSTKIAGVRGNINVFITVLKILLGCYDL